MLEHTKWKTVSITSVYSFIPYFCFLFLCSCYLALFYGVQMQARYEQELCIQSYLNDHHTYARVLNGTNVTVHGHRNILRHIGSVKLPVSYLAGEEMREMGGYLNKKNSCMHPHSLEVALE